MKVNRVIHGDCLNILKELPKESIDFVVADPDYNIADKTKITVRKGGCEILSNKEAFKEFSLEEKEGLKLISKVVNLLDKVLKETGSSVIFYDRNKITYLRDIGKEIGWNYMNQYALIKNNPATHIRKTNFRSGFELACIFNVNEEERKFNFLSQEKMKNYYEYNIGNHKETTHPTEKPVEPIKRLIRIFTEEEDLVLDPFIGSGTTAVACKQLNRNYIGIEKKKEYVEMARERIRKTKWENPKKQMKLS